MRRRRRGTSRVVVVGGGIGGLAAAIRLRCAGHAVTVFERREHFGGKVSTRVRDGFRFDSGPSLLTLPAVYDDVLRCAGTTLDEHLQLARLDPQFEYHWVDGSLAVHDDQGTTLRAVEQLHPGGGVEWRRWHDRAARIWEVAERTFLAGPATGIAALRRLRSPRDLLAIDPVRTLADAAANTFTDARLRQWAGRYATYSGSSPFRAPATLACISHIEQRFGAWYPMGGVGTLRDCFVSVAAECGVELIASSPVAEITHDTAAVHGVRLADGTRVPAEVVVCNADAEHLYADLAPHRRSAARVRRAGRSTSAFVVLAGVRGMTSAAHHTVWFSPDDRVEFAALDSGRLAPDPTIYACVSCRTDPTQAPVGHENWFLLVNVPAGAEIDGARHVAVVFDALARRGTDLRERLMFVEAITPRDLERSFTSPGGAIYGTSSNGRRAAFVRPGNRGPWDGLYLVGGSSHPGGGLPLVTLSARIVADLVAADGW